MPENQIVLSENAFKILSVEDTVKKYTPELSDNDIKGFVWYNRTLGIPMTGWEKWFIGGSTKSVVTANADINYLNQQYEVIGKFQKGDEVGKVTRFENTYGKITYVSVRRFDNSLCLVDKSYLNIDESKYSYDVSELDVLVKSYSLMYLNGMYLPLHVYSNTDYETLKNQLEIDKDVIVEKFGLEVYEYHKTITSGFTNMQVNHPIKDKRFRLNPFGDIAKEVKVFDDNNNESSIEDSFLDWTRTLKNSEFELVSKEVFRTRIIYNDRRTGETSTDPKKKEEAENNKREVADADLECQRLFSEYLTNIVDSDTVKVINKRINETYNRSIVVNTDKIPVGFVCSNKFKNASFALKPVQVEAFKFAVSRNNFCLALTVGFGKTSTLISVLSYLIGSGTINKPLLIVPKPVLKNWQKEMFGYWTNGKAFSFSKVKGWDFEYGVLTDCGFDFIAINNLSERYLKAADEIKNKKKCIVIGSYEALNKMYISNVDIRDFIIMRWKSLLEQSVSSGETDRESAKKIAKLESKLKEVDKEANIDLVSLGFDSIYFDEAHRLKNLFSRVSADKTNRVQSGFTGSCSDRSLRAFYITQYLQKIKGRIGFLTATPFSNSPLEVYTMLVYLNFPELVKNNVYKIVNFVELFFNETLEFKVNQNNKIISEAVMKNYKNKPILYKILSNTFLYKNDPKKANIQRPCLVQYPNKDMKLMLTQSPLQVLQRDALTNKLKTTKEYLLEYPEIEPYLDSFFRKFNSLGEAANALGLAGRILSASRCSALSPFAQSPLMLDFVTDERWRELYEFSPKIKFTIDCISYIMQYHEKMQESASGHLIYTGLGVNILPDFKEALEKICGFKKGLSLSLDDEEDDDGRNAKVYYDEVEIISGTADTEKEANRRERVSDLFNKGLVKVIIGTDTIIEGLNLQVNCPTEYVLTPTWNSSTIKQLQGRIHRQGNKFGYARAITPVVARTLDSFIYQKYEEKESRLNDIWQDDGLSTTESLDVDIKPEKQKELILNDASEIAKIRASMAEKKEVNEYNKLKDEYEALKKAISKGEQYKYYSTYFSSRLDKVQSIVETNYANLKKLYEYIKINPNVKPFLKSKKDRIETLIEYYGELLEKTKKAVESNLSIDLINIFTGSFRRRGYDLSIDDEDVNTFLGIASQIKLINPKDLLKSDIFMSVGISRNTKYYNGDFESIYDFSAIYGECFNAEKIILNPEGVSLNSTTEELQAILKRFETKVEDKITSIQKNFDIDESMRNGFKINAKKELIDQFETTARIELDSENKLAKYGGQLAEYFTERTNKQLSYKLKDIDLNKCDIPYSDVDVERLADNENTINIDKIPKDYSAYKKLYDSIKKVLPNLDSLGIGFYEKSGANGDAYMPLSVEIQDLSAYQNVIGYEGKLLIMEQNYIQNGDLMTDPRIDFAIYQKEGLAIPLTYETNGTGTYTEYVVEGKIVNMKNLVDTSKFCIDTWMPNLVEQGRVIGKPEIVEEQQQIKLKKKSTSAAEINTIGDKFFEQNPDKVLGDFSISDFRNMIVVKGTKADVQKYFDAEFSKDDTVDDYATGVKHSDLPELSKEEFLNSLNQIDNSDLRGVHGATYEIILELNKNGINKYSVNELKTLIDKFNYENSRFLNGESDTYEQTGKVLDELLYLRRDAIDAYISLLSEQGKELDVDYIWGLEQMYKNTQIPPPETVIKIDDNETTIEPLEDAHIESGNQNDNPEPEKFTKREQELEKVEQVNKKDEQKPANKIHKPAKVEKPKLAKVDKVVSKPKETKTASSKQPEPTIKQMTDYYNGLMILAKMGDKDAKATADGLKILIMMKKS